MFAIYPYYETRCVDQFTDGVVTQDAPQQAGQLYTRDGMR